MAVSVEEAIVDEDYRKRADERRLTMKVRLVRTRDEALGIERERENSSSTHPHALRQSGARSASWKLCEERVEPNSDLIDARLASSVAIL